MQLLVGMLKEQACDCQQLLEDWLVAPVVELTAPFGNWLILNNA
jgi:hypothetical protein